MIIVNEKDLCVINFDNVFSYHVSGNFITFNCKEFKKTFDFLNKTEAIEAFNKIISAIKNKDDVLVIR